MDCPGIFLKLRHQLVCIRRVYDITYGCLAGVSMCNFAQHFQQKLLSAWEYKSKCVFLLVATSERFLAGTANVFKVIHTYNRECGND